MFIKEPRMYRKIKHPLVTLEEFYLVSGLFLITMKFHLFVSVLSRGTKNLSLQSFDSKHGLSFPVSPSLF